MGEYENRGCTEAGFEGIKSLVYDRCPVPNRVFSKKRIKGVSDGHKALDEMTVAINNAKEIVELCIGSWGDKRGDGRDLIGISVHLTLF